LEITAYIGSLLGGGLTDENFFCNSRRKIKYVWVVFLSVLS